MTSHEPRVTAVITTFNRAHFLGDAIKSVLGQTMPDFELLILDNSSRDATEDVIRSFSDPRIRYLRHEPMPISPQRNIAINMARGEFVGFLDDDDVWLPHKLDAELAVFAQHDESVALVYGGYQFFDERGVFAFQKPLVHGKVLHSLLLERDGFCASASNPLLRRSVVQALGGYDDDVKSGEDIHLYLRLARDWMVEFTDEIVVSIRQHDGPRLIDNMEARILLEERVLRDFDDVMDDNLRIRFLKKIGGKYVRMGDMNRGREKLRCAIAMQPTNVEAIGQYLASFLGPSAYFGIHRRLLGLKKRSYLTSVNPSSQDHS